NIGAPVIPNPTLIQILVKYKALKDPKFLSKNVFLNDNLKIDDIERIADGQIGDKWSSTVSENEITTSESVNFKGGDLNAPNGQLSPSSDPNNPVPTLSDAEIEAMGPPE